MAKELRLEELEFSRLIKAGDGVIWGQGAAEPVPLTAALMAQRHDIGRFSVFLGATWSDSIRPEHADCVRLSAYCAAGRNRGLASAAALDILPCHYSHLGGFIRSGRLKSDVLLLQVAERNGEYSLAIAHEYLIPALDRARVVIAEVNAQAPFTYGERMLAGSDIDVLVRTDRPPLELRLPAPGEVELAIARNVAALIEDGATLELGLGALPDTILGLLADRRDLGIHSGVIGDKVAELMQRGVITNARKSIDRGVTTAGVMMGRCALLDFASENRSLYFRSSDYTHSPDVLPRIDDFVAINSAVEVDLTGQVNAEVAGGQYIGGVGGAVDFARGAQRSKGGLPVFAMSSTAGAASRVVARLGGPVTTPRSDAGVIVTEYGVADLRGLTLSARVGAMIAIAHPDHREELEREARTLGMVSGHRG